jgi:branched-chain amino acid transport system substrate-binding protein
MRRRNLLAAGTALLTSPFAVPILQANAEDWPGVTATEIKIGHTNPYSGPASAYGSNGKLQIAFWNMVNEQGGVAGRKINFITLDDAYNPSKTVEVVRRLVEQDQVSFLFQTLGTPTNSAIQKYVNQKKVPHLFIATGADKWGDYKNFPWTIGFNPSYRTEAQIYTKYILSQKPDAKIAILYQNDDFGKDYPAGVKDVLGDKFDQKTVQSTYETSDATIDSQITTLQGSGAEVLLVAATPKFAAQAIRKVHDLGWKPMFVMTNVAISVGTVMVPAGPENSIGMLSTNYLKDSTDPRWANDPGMNEWRAFMNKYMPGADQTDLSYVYAYGAAQTMLLVLKQCDGNFSRENIMKQATNVKDLVLGVALPGIKVNTSPTNFHPITAMQMIRWDGKTWAPIGEIIEGTST